MLESVNPIPTGFHTLTTHLHIQGAARYIEFLTRAFGAAEVDRSPGPGGKLAHVTMRIGDSLLMFSDDFGAEFGQPPLAQGRLPFHLHVYVPDADSVFDRAVAAGCHVEMPLADQFWGDRYGILRDPFGFRWAIGTRKENLTSGQIQERQAKAFGGGK